VKYCIKTIITSSKYGKILNLRLCVYNRDSHRFMCLANGGCQCYHNIAHEMLVCTPLSTASYCCNVDVAANEGIGGEMR
jgi:hypothetical protein